MAVGNVRFVLAITYYSDLEILSVFLVNVLCSGLHRCLSTPRTFVSAVGEVIALETLLVTLIKHSETTYKYCSTSRPPPYAVWKQHAFPRLSEPHSIIFTPL